MVFWGHNIVSSSFKSAHYWKKFQFCIYISSSLNVIIFWSLLFLYFARIKLNVWEYFILPPAESQKKRFVCLLLIIMPVLFLYLHTNYCFHSVPWKGWGCIFKQPRAINNLHTIHTQYVCSFLPKLVSSQLTSIKSGEKWPLKWLDSTFQQLFICKLPV